MLYILPVPPLAAAIQNLAYSFRKRTSISLILERVSWLARFFKRVKLHFRDTISILGTHTQLIATGYPDKNTSYMYTVNCL